VSCGWEGNRRSGVALATRTVVYAGLYGVRNGDENPAYTRRGVRRTLPLHSVANGPR